MFEEIAYSATGDNLLLDVALAEKIDVNRKSEHFGCYPSTWAALKGAREAAQKLLRHSPGATADLNFITHYRGYIADMTTLNDYVKELKTRKE